MLPMLHHVQLSFRFIERKERKKIHISKPFKEKNKTKKRKFCRQNFKLKKMYSAVCSFVFVFHLFKYIEIKRIFFLIGTQYTVNATNKYITLEIKLNL